MNGEALSNLHKLQKVNIIGTPCMHNSYEGREQIANLIRDVSKNCRFDEESCGRVFLQVGLIIGGKETERGQWPFLVTLFYVETAKFFCSGSLISSQHVLTGWLIISLDYLK